MQNQKSVQAGIIRFIVEGAAQDSTRSLDLLRDIETTIDVNEMFAEQFETMTERCNHAIGTICNKSTNDSKTEIDKDGALQDILDRTMDVLEKLHDDFSARRLLAKRDHALRADDGVVESFDRVLVGVRAAYDSMNELVWAVLEHDADCSPLSGKGPFKSVDELLAAIKS